MSYIPIELNMHDHLKAVTHWVPFKLSCKCQTTLKLSRTELHSHWAEHARPPLRYYALSYFTLSCTCETTLKLLRTELHSHRALRTRQAYSYYALSQILIESYVRDHLKSITQWITFILSCMMRDNLQPITHWVTFTLSCKCETSL